MNSVLSSNFAREKVTVCGLERSPGVGQIHLSRLLAPCGVLAHFTYVENTNKHHNNSINYKQGIAMWDFGSLL